MSELNYSVACSAKRNEVGETIGGFALQQSEFTEGDNVVNGELLGKLLLCFAAALTGVAVSVASLSLLLVPVGSIVLRRWQDLRLRKARAAAVLSALANNAPASAREDTSAHLTNALFRVVECVIGTTPPKLLTFDGAEDVWSKACRGVGTELLATLVTTKRRLDGVGLLKCRPALARAKSGAAIPMVGCEQLATVDTGEFVTGNLAFARAEVPTGLGNVAWAGNELLPAEGAYAHELGGKVAVFGAAGSATSGFVNNVCTAVNTSSVQASVLVGVHRTNIAQKRSAVKAVA